MQRKNVNVIYAAALNNTIGRNNKLPWRIPRDLNFFRTITRVYNNEDGLKSNAIIMGRKTWESIGKRPLPGRLNIVLSSDTSRENEDALGIDEEESSVLLSSLSSALEYCDGNEFVNEVFVIGGGQIYEEAGAMSDRVKNVFHTRIGQNIKGDVKLSANLFNGFEVKEISQTYSENGYNYDFVRMINPQLYGQHYKEYNTPVFDTRSGEYAYIDLVDSIIRDGAKKDDRTGTGTYATFGNMMRFDLSESFPLLTTKRVFWKGVVEEILWFLRASTNSNELAEKGVHIWDGNGSREFLDQYGFEDREQGDLGPVYGFQWRHCGAEYKDMHTDYTGQGVDQIKQVLDLIKNDPDNRRMLVNAWNVKDVPQMALPPCHVLFQFFVENERLSCLLYQRSCDVGLGVPFNIASYALMTCLFAKMTGLKPGEFVHMLGDTHIYQNHVDPLLEQLKRDPRPFPILDINFEENKPIEDYTFEDFKLIGYNPHKIIKMDMAV